MFRTSPLPDPQVACEPPPSTPILPRGVHLAPLTATPEQNWPRVAAHLSRQGLPMDPGFQPRRFAGGLANLNYLLRLHSGEWAVLRRPPPGPLPPGSHDMAREHRILGDLYRSLPVAPRSYHLCDDLSVIGAPFQLLEFRGGVTIRGDRLEPLAATAANGLALSHLLVNGLVAIHAVDPVTAGLAGLGRPEGFLARAAKSWTARAVRVCGPELSPTVRRVASWLETHTENVGGDGTFLHNDFKLDNLVLNPDSLEPVAVLDWDMGTRGDALFDLATLLSYWTEASDPECMHLLAQMPTANAGFLSREEAALAYASRTGRSLSEFKVYRVMGMFKLGIVFHQLHARYRNGEVTDVRYAGFENLANELFAFTQTIVDDKVF